MIPKGYGRTIETIKLNTNLSLPSAIQGYCLACEFMRDWFLKEFEDGYFKTVFINGKNIVDDYRRVFNQGKTIKVVERPAVAIIPSITHDWDRENVDLYLGGKSLLIRRSMTHSQAFLRDEDHNLYLGMYLKQLEMPFTFRVRVGSRAQQLDIADYMRLAFRIGATQSHHLDLDFHVPYDIMLNIAKDVGFKIENDKIVDVYSFMAYLNAHSTMPFIYKFRTINGNSEFFIKSLNSYTHINCTERLSIDDGERIGSLDTNFTVEMNVVLRIPVPQVYFYLSKNVLEKKYSDRYRLNGLYTYRSWDPPIIDEHGWKQYLSTEWYNENYETYLDKINFRELLGNERLMRVIEYTKNAFISPLVFMNIKLYNDGYEVPIDIDWDTYDINVNADLVHYISKITIYVDVGYLNEQLICVEQLDKSRLKDNGEQVNNPKIKD